MWWSGSAIFTLRKACFLAGLNPKTAARKLSRARCDKLAAAVRTILSRAIRAGGSSLRDYVQSDGSLGCFQVQSAVYDRAGEPCQTCKAPIRQIVQGARSTYYCTRCQR